jgi:tetratricopeptide (TPR) repeat protein
MVTTLPGLSANPAVQQALALASRHLQSGNIAGADAVLAPFFIGGLPREPVLLNTAGVVRLNQGRPAEAADLFGHAARLLPREPMFPFNQGRALAALGQSDAAVQAFRAALKCKPDFVDAFYEMGALLHRTGKLAEAERAFRQILRQMPGHAPAKLMLGAVLVDAGRPQEAELPLRRAIAETADPRMQALLHVNLGVALRRQRKDEDALEQYDLAMALDPAVPGLAVHRGEALQNLGRHDQALAEMEAMLAKTPQDAGLHHGYNDLLYRLGREAEFLKSYDKAPPSRALLLGKAFFLSHAKRGEDAHAVYAQMLARDPADPVAAIGAANSLTMARRFDEAGTAFDHLLARQAGNAELFSCAAEAAVQAGDAQKAAWLCDRGLMREPRNASCLAILSIASRLLDDGRDEAINRYDTLVRSFDLEPPQGFSSMADFNHELNAQLDRLHPETREFINQSLRGGTQTPDQLFTADLPLVTRLKQRINEAVARYAAELGEDAAHPLLSRRTRDFGYAGSWSSRLRDCGFHVNHIHPMGWISSCYYVAVPDAAQDESQRQGWIKFGEPSFEAGLKDPIRRTVQPVPGRLVLFPSYMWHGTVPFRDAASRTTIAFDVVPT